jgi:hypothetical protein
VYSACWAIFTSGSRSVQKYSNVYGKVRGACLPPDPSPYPALHGTVQLWTFHELFCELLVKIPLVVSTPDTVESFLHMLPLPKFQMQVGSPPNTFCHFWPAPSDTVIIQPKIRFCDNLTPKRYDSFVNILTREKTLQKTWLFSAPPGGRRDSPEHGTQIALIKNDNAPSQRAPPMHGSAGRVP